MSDSTPSMDEEPRLPAAGLLDRCLELLTQGAGEPGTLELHDPLYLMRRDADPTQIASLWRALESYPHHSAASAIRGLLAAHLPRIENSLESVLARDEPIPEGMDPLEELGIRLSRSRRVRGLLEERITELEHRLSAWTRTANVMAAVGALAAVVALVGWLIALGALSIPWVDPPEIEVESVTPAPAEELNSHDE
jgi:hypothetical protein